MGLGEKSCGFQCAWGPGSFGGVRTFGRVKGSFEIMCLWTLRYMPFCMLWNA